MGDAAVIALQLLHGDEVHGGIVIGKVVGHGFDLVFHAGGISTVLEHHKTLAGVLLAGGKLRAAAGAHGIQRGVDGNGVLARVSHALDAADSVGMALADSLAPEGVILSGGQHGAGIHAV